MKRTVRLAILGTMLHGSAHAAEPGSTAEPLLGKERVSHSAPSAEKNTRAVRGKKAKPKIKIAAEKIDPQAKVKQDSVTETPPGSIEQSIQLRGVRG
jgi:hypothetical protein